MDFNINDIFGHHPGRPDHPDFWRLSETVLKLDGRLAEDPTAFESTVGEVVDLETCTYMAKQRAMRVMMHLGIDFDTTTGRQLLAALASAWIDGFMVGSVSSQVPA